MSKQVPGRGVYSEAARQERLEFLRRETGARLDAVGASRIDPTRLTSNLENMIGSVEIPVGIAGPLLFSGQAASGPIYLPLATTEGTLVASVSRGARAATESGGVVTRVIRQRMVRVPCFEFARLDAALRFANWLHAHERAVADRACEVSRHARLVALDPQVFGSQVHVEFAFETADAAGQNMTTACTWHACQWILERLREVPGLDLVQFLIDGNMSGDKKPSWASAVRGRGTRVAAEAVIDAATLRRVLKVEPAAMLRGFQVGVTGSLASGMMGLTFNVSNVLAAAFAACGQDIACVHESSTGFLDMQPSDGGGVRASLLLPNLVVGTVGGGTALPHQAELLGMLDCSGVGCTERLAEILAGFCLALEISTVAAVSAGHFANAHERLGRNRPVRFLRHADLDAGFFQEALAAAPGGTDFAVESVEPLGEQRAASIVTEHARRRMGDKLAGLLPFRLHGRSGTGAASLDIVAKVKPLDSEVLLATATAAKHFDEEVFAHVKRFEHLLGFEGCHSRELAIYRQQDPRFTRFVPRLHGLHEDPEREAYVIVLEQLRDVELLDSADVPGAWKARHIQAAIDGLAELHSVWYGREDELHAQPWLGRVPCAATRAVTEPLWSCLARRTASEFSDWIAPDHVEWMERQARGLRSWWRDLEDMPRTLCHNDFSPRNLCLRRDGDALRLCAYDWELATLHVPQRDLVELLAFVLPDDVSADALDRWLELHRQALARASGRSIEAKTWRLGFALALRDYALSRLSLYLMGYAVLEWPFLPRVYATLRRLSELAAPMEVSR